jgi:hypothetical protein
MYSLIPKVRSNPSPDLFFFNLFIKHLKTAILLGSEKATGQTLTLSNSFSPDVIFPVRFMIAETKASLTVEGLGVGAEMAYDDEKYGIL